MVHYHQSTDTQGPHPHLLLPEVLATIVAGISWNFFSQASKWLQLLGKGEHQILENSLKFLPRPFSSIIGFFFFLNAPLLAYYAGP